MLLQSTPQVVPLQTGLPLGGSTQAVQPVAVQPDAVLLFATHDVGAAAGQPWKPVAQVTLQVVPLQTAVPLAASAQAVQPLAEQPEATLLLATQSRSRPCRTGESPCCRRARSCRRRCRSPCRSRAPCNRAAVSARGEAVLPLITQVDGRARAAKMVAGRTVDAARERRSVTGRGAVGRRRTGRTRRRRRRRAARHHAVVGRADVPQR